MEQQKRARMTADEKRTVEVLERHTSDGDWKDSDCGGVLVSGNRWSSRPWES